jgi:hypothetical protein
MPLYIFLNTGDNSPSRPVSPWLDPSQRVILPHPCFQIDHAQQSQLLFAFASHPSSTLAPTEAFKPFSASS